MSTLPEFLQPANTQEPKKPSPKAGLPEFLRDPVTQTIDNVQPIPHIRELIKRLDSPEYKQNIVWLDLEINPKTEALIDGAIVIGDDYWCFNARQFEAQALLIYTLLDKAKFLGGHNLIDFDLPRLILLLIKALDKNRGQHSQLISKLSQPDTLIYLQNKTWDTLLLSSLFIPHQPSHALAKLYKANVNYNDPILDCVESRFVFELCVKAWQALPINTQILFYKLLPAFSILASDSYFSVDENNIFDIDAVLDILPEGNNKGLIQLINNAISASSENLDYANHDKKNSEYLWQNLGLASFINWLRYFDKPQARRPVWLKKHPIYGSGFETAEQVFWTLDNPSEAWINQQCQFFFGFEALKQGQMSIVKAVLTNKDIPLGILPTGGGKSLTFQLPALIFSKSQRKLTVIISPLKALIEDQVVNLHQQLPNYESRIAYLTSGQTPETQKDVLSGVWQGDIDILYLSPERLRTHSIRQLLKNRPPAFWVLDEAHTLSQWGTDFRPDFLRIADHIIACYGDEVRQRIESQLLDNNDDQSQLELLARPEDTESNDEASNIKLSHPFESPFNPPMISLVTATASARVKDDLEAELVNKISALTDNKPLVQYGVPIDEMRVWRDDITAHFIEAKKEERKTRIFNVLQERKQAYDAQYSENSDIGVAIVYLRSRKGCDEYAEDFAKEGLTAVSYHSKLDDSQKKSVLSKFKNNELDVVVCTNAFGMGIDKEGIHTVIHSGPPNNIESYIQEIGRAARKEHEVGEAYMMWSEEDINYLFVQERKTRIPNTKTLHECWTAIKPTLIKSPSDQWFSGAILSPILDTDNDVEQLNTQIRVALLALERYGLLSEKDQQPAYINIRLLDTPPKSDETRLATLYKELQQISDNAKPSANDKNEKVSNQLDKAKLDKAQNLNRYHLPELAIMLGYSIKELFKQLRALVDAGFAQWQVVVRVRIKHTHLHLKREFNRLNKINDELRRCFASAYIANFGNVNNDDMLEQQGYTLLNTKLLDDWMVQQQVNLSCKRHILPMFRGLGILKIRQQGRTHVAVSSTKRTKEWLKVQERVEGWDGWLSMAEELTSALEPLFEQGLLPNLPDQKGGGEEDFDIDELARGVSRTPDDILTQLEQLQRLDLIELSRLDDEKNTIFFVGKNRKKVTRYNPNAYNYLQTHYQDRCVRIHVLNHWLRTDSATQQAMIEDYFSKSLQTVVDTYISDDVDASKPYLKDYKKEILPDRFSETQASIVQETNRAAIVLAGPGSGKTTVVVHRVAYLLMIEEIKPEKILVLAYNRLAVLELRARLTDLIGHYGNGVTIKTFHGLARQITGLSEKEAPDAAIRKIKARLIKKQNGQYKDDDKNNDSDGDARYQWMIEEAIRQLQEQPQHYQYIMVDEFQDIDEYQYEIIRLLAGLYKEEEAGILLQDTQHAVEQEQSDTLLDGLGTRATDDATSNDNFDQQGYLMVVGDDDQNLYAFRGASIEYIQKFASNYHINNEQKYYLLDNYRSANNIVALANDFIEKGLSAKERLKQQDHQVRATNAHIDSPIRHGFYSQVKGVDGAAWLANDVQERLNQSPISADTETPATIAVLAPIWSSFDTVQHYLEAANITSQRYNESDQLIPINSLVGQALVNHLSENRLSTIVGLVTAYLEEWRKEHSYSHLDMAWDAILNRTKALQDINHEQLLQVLEVTFYHPDTQVVLITYHSAKGMEFDHVYVIDDSLQGNDNVRPLYVALTRAKQSLTILQHQSRQHPILATIAHKHGKQVDLPKVAVPKQLVFHRFLAFHEIFLTPKDLVSEDGREFVKSIFAKNDWSEGKQDVAGSFGLVRYHKQKNLVDGFYTKKNKNLMVQLSRKFKETYLNKTSINEPEMIGFTTTLFYQKELKYYKDAGYHGDETSHYLIVPYVQFSVQCR